MGQTQRILTAVHRASKPKDAATLVLVRTGPAGPLILLGKRASGHSFMPGKYVFPGGKVDRCDRRVGAISELNPADEAALAAHRTRRAPRDFALAAIRETWEETGLVVGQSGDLRLKCDDASWVGYYKTGARPHLAQLTFIARAITPPMRHKRFDTRFFVANADVCLYDSHIPKNSAELHDLRWFTPEEALALDLPNVTRFILGEVYIRLKDLTVPHKSAFLRWTRAGHQLTRL